MFFSAFLISIQNFYWRILDNPLVIKDNDEKTSETNAFIRVTSVKSKIYIVYLQSFYSRK